MGGKYSSKLLESVAAKVPGLQQVKHIVGVDIVVFKESRNSCSFSLRELRCLALIHQVVT